MSTVVVDVSNDYESDLTNSYQLLKNNDGTYSIYVAMSPLTGYFMGEGCEGKYHFDTLGEAWQHFCDLINQEEQLDYAI